MTAPRRAGQSLTGPARQETSVTDNAHADPKAPASDNAPAKQELPKFDGPAWKAQADKAGALYEIRRIPPWSKTNRGHADYLLYLDWRRECDALQAECDARNAIAARKYKENQIREMMNYGIRPVVLFANWKSGSKTTLAAYVGTIFFQLGWRQVVLLPSTSNSKTGASGEITGVSGELATLTAISRDLDQLTTTRELSDRLPKTHQGLTVVVEDEDGEFDAPLFTPEEYRPIVVRFYQLSDGILALDLGNDDVNEKVVPAHAGRAADVFVFTASNTQVHSIVKMERTMNMFRKDPYKGTDADLHPGYHLPGESRATIDKVRHALVVMNGVRPDDPPYDFDKLRLREEHGFQEGGPPPWEGEGYNIPWDPYVFGGHLKKTIFDTRAIDTPTYDGYVDVAWGILREGARAKGIMDEQFNKLFPPFTPEKPQFPPEPDYASNRPREKNS